LNTLAIIIPIKRHEPKSRLNKILTLDERKTLQLVMLYDILGSISKEKMLNHTYIVSSDKTIVDDIKYKSINFIEEHSEKGVNAAVEMAISKLMYYDGWLLLPADIPLFSTIDLEIVSFLMNSGYELIVSPSRKLDGTNLLLILKDKKINFHYDDDSFRKHLLEAQTKNLKVATYYSKSVALDIDNEEDVFDFLESKNNTYTMSYLSRKIEDKKYLKRKH
jgi:2-phospho-L-lactate guanylyltransferase